MGLGTFIGRVALLGGKGGSLAVKLCVDQSDRSGGEKGFEVVNQKKKKHSSFSGEERRGGWGCYCRSMSILWKGFPK